MIDSLIKNLAQTEISCESYNKSGALNSFMKDPDEHVFTSYDIKTGRYWIDEPVLILIKQQLMKLFCDNLNYKEVVVLLKY